MLIHKTLDQHRAASAWKAVIEAKELLKSDFKDYASLVKKFPALVMRNGLGPAIAFLMSKDDKKHKLLITHIEKWLCKEAPYSPYRTTASEKKQKSQANLLVDAITKHSSVEYFFASEECLAYLQWLRLFASALSEKKTKEE